MRSVALLLYFIRRQEKDLYQYGVTRTQRAQRRLLMVGAPLRALRACQAVFILRAVGSVRQVICYPCSYSHENVRIKGILAASFCLHTRSNLVPLGAVR